MKTLRRPITALILAVLGLALFIGNLGHAADLKPSPAAKVSASNKPPPGVAVAHAISTITGVAISPLLGAGAIGAWKYYQTPAGQRSGLPWYAQPWFWAPALLLVTLVFVKDTAGTALPTALKKPMDILEVFENKVSALVIAGAFVPLIATIVESTAGPDSGMYQSLMLASFNPASLLSIITVPVAIIVFFIVWMAAHVINVLIIISPFTTVDAALKSVRLALLSTIPLTSMVDPYIGAAWAIVIIVASYFLAGWALRLTVFGTVFGWDYLTFRSARTTPDPERNRVFTAKRIDKAPIRSYGHLSLGENGRLVLTYRPLLVMPARQLILPEGTYVVGRGLLYPEVIRIEGDSSDTVLTLPPRLNGHEEAFNQIYRMAGIQNVGLQACWEWIRSAFRSKPALENP